MSPSELAPAAQPLHRGPGWVFLDLVAMLLLVVLAGLGLASTFHGWGFLVVAVGAAGAGILVVLGTLRFSALSLLVSGPLVWMLLAGPVAVRAEGFGAGIPNAQTLSAVMQGSATGWGQMLTTLPWVDLDGAPALVPFLLGYLGGLLSGSLALRSRSPGLPVLPLLGVLVVVLLVRRPADGPVEWHPLAFAVVAVAWVLLRGAGFRSARLRGIRGVSRARVARGIAAALVVLPVLLVTGLLTSARDPGQGESLVGKVGPLSEVRNLDSPLRRFRSYTQQPPGGSKNLYSKTLVEIGGAPRGTRVRFLSLDLYDGKVWRPGNHTMAGAYDDRFQNVDTSVRHETAGTPVRVVVTVKKSYDSAWVPTVGSLTALRFLRPDRNDRRDEIRYNIETSTVALPVGLSGGNDYEMLAVLPDDRLTAKLRPWPRPVLSVAGLTRADPLIRRVLGSPAPPMRKVFALARYLRLTGYYSNGSALGEEIYEPGHDIKRLFEGFLLAPRLVGDDEQYAAAMAVLANRVGVPARVVVGAVVPRSGKVRGADVQAWVELRVADGSWRTLPTERFMSKRPPIGQLPPPPLPRVPGVDSTQPDAAAKPDTSSDQQQLDNDLDRTTSWRTALVRVLPALVLLVLMLVVPVLKRVRRQRRRNRGRRSDQMAGAWAELVDHARDLGISVKASASRPSQARVLSTAGALSRRGDEGVFTSEEPQEQEVEDYWHQMGGERRALSSSRGILRRAWARFNPESLRRRRHPD